ncbi:signal peptidase I [Plantibacter flavus]|uniref:signal peptidase I n=1 Tax=Plantibacter flavus TaxID=150123 RepID=UPI00339152CB
MEPSSARRRIVSSSIVVVALGARVLALLALCLLAWAAVPKLVGWIPTTVASGSMEPRILTGDVVVSAPLDGADAAAGQVVLVDDPAKDDTYLLHRVVERTSAGLRLQGDANRQPDRQLVDDQNVHGLGILRVPFIGLPIVWAHEGRWAELAVVAAAAAATGCAILWTRRFLVDERGRESSPGRLRAMAPAGGVALAGVLAIAAVMPTAGASWTSSAVSSGNRLGTGVFACLGQSLGSPLIRLDFSEAGGPGLVDSGSGGGAASLSGTAERIDGTCGDSPYLRLDGLAGQVVTSPRLPQPTTFSVEAWFRTTAPQGKLIGFGNAQSGASSAHDRHVYVGSDGRLVFGTWDGSGPQTITTSRAVTDGAWHHVVATMSATDGMALYLDGELVGTHPNTTLQNYSGYWRVGYDTISGLWPSSPSSPWFAGDLDGVGVYDRALSAFEAAEHASSPR